MSKPVTGGWDLALTLASQYKKSGAWRVLALHRPAWPLGNTMGSGAVTCGAIAAGLGEIR